MEVKNRRREERHPRDEDMMIFVEPIWGGLDEGQKADSRCIDISLSGFRGRTKVLIDVGDIVKASIGNVSQSYNVKWVRKDGDAYEFGCEAADQ
jgi:hypothetical protein